MTIEINEEQMNIITLDAWTYIKEKHANRDLDSQLVLCHAYIEGYKKSMERNLQVKEKES